AAFAAGYQSLDDAGLDGPAGREALVVGQPLRRQSEGIFADNRRDRYFDPLVTGPFVTAAFVPMDCPPRQAERPCYLLPRALAPGTALPAPIAVSAWSQPLDHKPDPAYHRASASLRRR